MKVRTEELAPIIRQFVDRHNLSYPLRYGGNMNAKKDHTPVMHGNEYIIFRSGVTRHKLDQIVGCKKELIDFDSADKIMCAIDRPDVFINGEVEVLIEDE